MKTPRGRVGGGSVLSHRPAIRAGAVVLLALLAVLVSQYGYAVSVPFINDDYIFLDKTRGAAFLSNWALGGLQFHWYRPWSRELHYWTLQRLVGAREPAFHLVSFALWLAIGVAYAALVRRLAGVRVAGVATAGLVALAAWGVPLVWIAGVQELWMLLFALLALLAQWSGRHALAAAAFGGALLSKETAAVLPAVAVALEWGVRGVSPRDALRRTAAMWAMLVPWAAVHPLLGGRLRHPIHETLGPGQPQAGLPAAVRTLLMIVNLDRLPAPLIGVARSLVRGLPAAAALAALVLWAARTAAPAAVPASGAARTVGPATDTAPAGRDRAVRAGLLWALIAWLPPLAPGLGWHAYYALLGAFGAWLAIGALLAQRPVFAAAVVAALALLRSAQASTPSLDWGSEFYQARAGAFIRGMRDDLRRRVPSLPAHSRLYFALVPNNVGFMTAGAPALRVWYGDSTLSGGFFSDYAPRPRGTTGDDRFFRYDGLAGWVELTPGESSAPASPDPLWARDLRELAATFARADDWPRATAAFERLARARPDDASRALEAGVARGIIGDTSRALAWLRRADSLPGAPDSVRRVAHELQVELSSSGAARTRPPGR